MARKTTPSGTPSNALASLNALQADMNRLLDDLCRGVDLRCGARGGTLAERALTGPSMRVQRGEQAIEIEVALPGYHAEEIEITIAEGRLGIAGSTDDHARGEGENAFFTRRTRRSFRRTVSLGDDADEDAVEARFADGVLRIRIPRRPGLARARTRRIPLG